MYDHSGRSDKNKVVKLDDNFTSLFHLNNKHNKDAF